LGVGRFNIEFNLDISLGQPNRISIST
jgi:hypothetical protein